MNEIVRLPDHPVDPSVKNQSIRNWRSSRHFGECFAGSGKIPIVTVFAKPPRGSFVPTESTFAAMSKIRSRSCRKPSRKSRLRRDGSAPRYTVPESL